MRLFLTILFLAVTCADSATVTICEFYDNRKCAVAWTSDDLFYSPGYSRYDRFMDAAHLAVSNHMVYSPGVVTKNVHPFTGMPHLDGWTPLQTEVAIDKLIPITHSFTHPVDITTTTYSNEYVFSRTDLLSEIEYPWQFTYKGKEYLPAFIQWGGCTNIDYDVSRQYLTSNDYLACRWVNQTSSGEWPAWNESLTLYGHTSQLGMVNTTVRDGRVMDGKWSNTFDNVYASGGIYVEYDHAWQDYGWVYGTNSAKWAAFVDYVGNRKDVWYVDFSSLYTYHYLQDQVPPTITTTNLGPVFEFTVTGDSAERDKYGLSYPLTYKFTKPAGWMHSVGVYVYYRDTMATNWALMEEKTTNDYFTGINTFRDANDVVYISQGLPQTSDTFDLLIKPCRVPQHLQAFSCDGAWFCADVIKEDVVPMLQYTTNLLNPAWTDCTPSSIETNGAVYRLYIDPTNFGRRAYFRAVKDISP